jgi:hypothetical protein
MDAKSPFILIWRTHFITFVHSQENKVYASCKFVEHVEQFGVDHLDAYFKEQRYPRSRIAIDGYDHFIKFDLPKLISI